MDAFICASFFFCIRLGNRNKGLIEAKNSGLPAPEACGSCGTLQASKAELVLFHATLFLAGVYLACPVRVLDASPLPRWPSQTRVQGGFVDWRGAKNKAQRQKPGPGDLEEVL